MRTPIEPLNPESYDALAALSKPLGKRACPLYGRAAGRRYSVIGTAVPVRGQKYAALLTAAHVIDQLEDGHVVMAGSRSFLRFPAIKFSHSRRQRSVDVDVAAIALPAEAAAELAAYYEFTEAGEIGDFDDYSKLTLYGFVGCSHTKNRDGARRSTERMVKPYVYMTREYTELPGGGGKHSAVHVTLRALLRTLSGPEGRIISAPDPHGIGGCGVWKSSYTPKRACLPRRSLSALVLSTTRGNSYLWRPALAPPTIAVARLWKQFERRTGPADDA